jgi:large subunit ribosomal protein L22
MAKTKEKPAVTEVRAQAKWVRCSPRKARLVLDTIRGRTVPEARTVLAFSARASAREINKVLRSAVANAEANCDPPFNGDEMVISACYADGGPKIKRWKPRARGRADRILKPICHITIKLAPLTSIEGAPSKGAAKAAVPKSEAPPKPEPVEAPAEAPAEPEEQTAAAEAPAEAPIEEKTEAKPKAAPKKAAAKPRAEKAEKAKKAEKAEDKPSPAPKRKPRAKKKAEE